MKDFLKKIVEDKGIHLGSPEHQADLEHKVEVTVHKEEPKEVPVINGLLDDYYWKTGIPKNFHLS